MASKIGQLLIAPYLSLAEALVQYFCNFVLKLRKNILVSVLALQRFQEGFSFFYSWYRGLVQICYQVDAHHFQIHCMQYLWLLPLGHG